MAHLFSRDRTSSLGESKRRMSMSGNINFNINSTPSLYDVEIQNPFGELSINLSDSELRETAYEIFVAACRSSVGRPLTYISSERSPSSNSSSPTSSSSSSSFPPSLQRSLTSTAASKVKKALGLKSKMSPLKESSSVSSSGRFGHKKNVTIGELMRIQMRVSESTDSRTRRALMRSFAGQGISDFG